MTTVLTILLLVCICTTDITGVMVELADVITSLGQLFNSRCIILYSSSDVATSRLYLTVVKRLMSTQHQSQVSVLTRVESDHNLPRGCCRPLLVLPFLFSTTREGVRSLRIANQILARRRDSVWLQFLDPGESLDERFQGVDIPFDCEFLVGQRDQDVVNLTEIYRVREGLPLQRFHFGFWDPRWGLEVTRLHFHERRHNLQGIVLKAVVMDDSPAVELDDQQNPKITGFDGKIITILAEELNFTLNVIVQKDMQWGKPLPDGSWDGMIGRIISGEVDMSVNSMFYSTLRQHVIDFTTPTSNRVFNLFVGSRSKRDIKWSHFAKPFSRGLFVTIAATVLVLGVVVGSLYKIWCRSHEGKETQWPYELSYFNSCFCILGLVLQQGSELTTGPTCCQVIFLTTLLMAVVLMSAYSGILISFLTVEEDKAPFQGISGLIADKSYSAGVINVNPEFYNRTFNGSGAMMFHKLSGLIAADRTPPTSVLDGLMRVCRSKFVLLVPEDAVWREMRNIPCRVRPILNSGYKVSQALPLAKHSPYRTLFNHVLHNIKSNGVMAKALLDSQQWAESRKNDNNVIVVQLEDVTPVLVMLLAAVVLAAAILAAEWATDRLVRMKRRRRWWKKTRETPYPWAL